MPKKPEQVDPRLQQIGWEIWGHCRDNRESCDSEKHSKVVYDFLRVACHGVMQGRDAAKDELEAVRSELAVARKLLRSGEMNVFEEWLATKDGKRHAKMVGSNRVTSLQAAFKAGAKISKPTPKAKKDKADDDLGVLSSDAVLNEISQEKKTDVLQTD